MGLAIVGAALILSGLVFGFFALLDRIGSRTEDEPETGPMHYDERWCGDCHAIVQVDVKRSDAFTAVECCRCGESIDLIFHPGMDD